MLREDHRLVPDLMILTGDLTEWGMKPEFDDVLGLIMGLEKELSLTRERLIVIPGNHDINRKACEAYFNECEADTIQPAKPYWAKWKHYVRFFGELYGDVPQKREFTKAQPWTLFEIEQLKIVVAGLNSTIAESHCDEDHYGWVGEPQLRWFAEKLESYRQDEWLRIGAVHHNVVRGAKLDDENLRDADDLKKILRKHLNAVLHGHTHEADMSFWIDQNVPTLSTGSAAVTREARPDEVPNQYQIIQFWPEHMVRYSRAYDPRGKEWIPDARIREGEVAGRQTEQIQFQSVHAAFPDEKPSGELPSAELREDKHPARRGERRDTMTAVKVFLSYAHEDEQFLNELNNHLGALRGEGLIEVWWDREIPPGDKWDQTISDALNSANLIILLISPAFIASPFCYKNEMRYAVARHEAHSARVIPIIVRPCFFEPAPFAKLEGLPKDMKPVASWPLEQRDNVWREVVKGLYAAVHSCSIAYAAPRPSISVESRESTTESIRNLDYTLLKNALSILDFGKKISQCFQNIYTAHVNLLCNEIDRITMTPDALLSERLVSFREAWESYSIDYDKIWPMDVMPLQNTLSVITSSFKSIYNTISPHDEQALACIRTSTLYFIQLVEKWLLYPQYHYTLTEFICRFDHGNILMLFTDRPSITLLSGYIHNLSFTTKSLINYADSMMFNVISAIIEVFQSRTQHD